MQYTPNVQSPPIKKIHPQCTELIPMWPWHQLFNPNGGKRSVNTAIPIHPTLHCQVSASNYKTITANPRVRSLLFAKSTSLQRPKEGCTSTVRPLEGKNQDTRPLNPLAEDARTRSRSERPVFQSAAKYIEFFWKVSEKQSRAREIRSGWKRLGSGDYVGRIWLEFSCMQAGSGDKLSCSTWPFPQLFPVSFPPVRSAAGREGNRAWGGQRRSTKPIPPATSPWSYFSSLILFKSATLYL